MGGAFMSGSKCDTDGRVFIRKLASDRPLLGPVVRVDPDTKATTRFDPVAFSDLALNRTDAFSPAMADSGLYQIAQRGILPPAIYVLHFSGDGTPSSSARLDADMEVYTFAAFADGNFLVSGVKRDVQNKDDRGHNFTAVFSADGRELAQLSFPKPALPGSAAGTSTAKKNGPGAQSASPSQKSSSAEGKPLADQSAPMLDLSDAETGPDGNLYVMRKSSPALIYVIAPSGVIQQTFNVAGPRNGSAMPNVLHVSGNRLAISFWSDEKASQTIVVVDATSGRKIATYSVPAEVGPAFACYQADADLYTFLRLGEGNTLEIIRAETD